MQRNSKRQTEVSLCDRPMRNNQWDSKRKLEGSYCDQKELWLNALQRRASDYPSEQRNCFFFLTDQGYTGFLYVEMIKPDIAFKSVWWPSTEGLYLVLWEAFLICCSCCPMRNGWLKFLSARKPDWAKIHFKCFWNQKHVTGCLESPTKRGSSAYLDWAFLSRN